MVALHHRGIAAVVIRLHVSNCRLHEHQAARRRLWYALHADGPTPIPHPNRATPAPTGTTHPRALALARLSASSLRYTSAPDTNAGRRRVLSEPRRPTEPAPHRFSGPEPRRASRGKPSQDNRGTGIQINRVDPSDPNHCGRRRRGHIESDRDPLVRIRTHSPDQAWAAHENWPREKLAPDLCVRSQLAQCVHIRLARDSAPATPAQ